MKKLLFAFILFAGCYTSAVYSQAFSGEDARQRQIGVNFSQAGTGISYWHDRGINDYLSYGGYISYTITNDYRDDLLDKLELEIRLTGHSTYLITICDCFDIYSGINLSLQNLGTHIGTRFMFTDTIGIFAEANIPIKQDLLSKDFYHRYGGLVVFSTGISLSLD